MPYSFVSRMCLALALSLAGAISLHAANDFNSFLQPLMAKSCVKCHGGKNLEGEVNLKRVASTKQLLADPKLIDKMIDALDSRDMPPEDEPQPSDAERTKAIAVLKSLLRQATSAGTAARSPVRRLNRFQYNNSVKDLFRLKLDVFPLSEKLLTRHSKHLLSQSGKMDARVEVSCDALNPKEGLKLVRAFPKDLRATHGFDNQANQLTLSPLLLDSFLKLSVSIVESPDFNANNVGIWKEFFQQPAANLDQKEEVRKRLGTFLKLAFRRPVDDATLGRYTSYVMAKMAQGLSFTDSMKKVSSAVLSSPMFLYRSSSTNPHHAQFELASKLSYFLWASGPDLELLELAEKGELAKPDVLNKTVDRMLADAKIERFLDTFPAQWMQLENILAVTPDPQKFSIFHADPGTPASMHMIAEPLLLFDAAFVENRPVIELVAPKFSYQSDFLKTWYTDRLKPPEDQERIVRENHQRDLQRQVLQKTIDATRAELDQLLEPIREKLLAAKSNSSDNNKPLDLKPVAAWDFNGDLKDSVGSLDLTAHGKVTREDGVVTLDNAYLQSKHLPFDLTAKSMDVWLKVHDLNQRGGGAMTVQTGPGFDSIVLGERRNKHWISGSDHFRRTKDFPDSTPETKQRDLLRLTMVYDASGTVTLYRDSKPYGKPFRNKNTATFPKGRSFVLFGLRHLPAGGNRYLRMSLEQARLYNRALTAEEVAASANSVQLFVTNAEIDQALTPDQRKKKLQLLATLQQSETAFNKVPKNQDIAKQRQDAVKRIQNDLRGKLRSRTFHRVAATDPRYGGVITNAAALTLTSGSKRTKPISRGAWIIEVIFNDPPPPPPNDVPPLDEENGDESQTIREKFAEHRENKRCASCHARIDPLGFALENFDSVGRWRENYDNLRKVDASGTLLKKHKFNNVVDFKNALVKEEARFAKAFTGHLMRFALSRELAPGDSLTVDEIVRKAEPDRFKLRSIIRGVILSKGFSGNQN